MAEVQYGFNRACRYVLDNPFQVFGLKVGYADVAYDAFVAQRHQRRQRLVDNLVEVGELDVVYVDKVYVPYVEPFHAFIHAVGYALSRIVPCVYAVLAVAAHLCGEVILIPRYFLEGLAEYGFGLVVSVIWRHVYEVDSVVDCRMHGLDAFGLAYVVEYSAERRRSEAEV